jgi:hypothetical protein
MKQFYTVVLDRLTTCSDILASEPYETGWADEALVFVRIHEIEKGAILHGKVQVSVDGVTWVDEGTVFSPMEKVGDYFVKVKEFGGWLRLVLEPNAEKNYKVTTYLVLKG